jgi:precorrin-6Y C5,15-methyltransferase (decarboxylating)
LLVLAGDGSCAGLLARMATEWGYGDSPIWVLEQLGGPAERIRTGTARNWAEPEHDSLTVVALHCVPEPGRPPLPRGPGLPDEAFEHDGQLTKRELRALAVSALAPQPGQLLWDIGAGAGSVAIEWMRSYSSCLAVAVEAQEERCVRIQANSYRLGVPELRVVQGRAPEACAGLPTPDAVFVGGAVSEQAVLEEVLAALRPGGRLVAHAVTLQAEQALVSRYHQLGGSLTRIAVERAASIGRFTGWRPARPVIEWSYHKEAR